MAVFGTVKVHVVIYRHIALAACISLAVGACLTMAACRAYYSAPEKACITVSAIDGLIAAKLQAADTDQLLTDPLRP